MSATIITKATAPDLIGNMIEEYQGKNLFGKITIYFEDGAITSVRVEDSIHPEGLLKKYGKIRQRFVVKSKIAGSVQSQELANTNNDGNNHVGT